MTMDYARLGNTGLTVSRICLGCMSYGDPGATVAGSTMRWQWALKEDEARPFFKRAVELGINFFDTANVYSFGASEEITGRALREFAHREDVVIATKVHGVMRPGPNGGGLSRKAILHEIDASLRRLGIDYVDLYQIHRWDPATPIEETMEALHDVVRMGKARYLGASSMHAWQFAKAQSISDLHGWTPFISMQNHYNLVYREEEREMIPLCLDQGIGLIPWSPMARGFFGGNRQRGGGGETARAKSDPFADQLYFRDEDFRVADRAWEIAREHQATASQIALSWMLHKPYITAPIIGSSKLEHLNDSIAALEIKLTPEEIKRLEERYLTHPVLGHS